MSLVAIFQSDLKRMFAYSSIAQIGYITLGIALTNAAGLTGAIAHLFNHSVTKGALFLLAGGISLRCGERALQRSPDSASGCRSRRSGSLSPA